MVDMADRLAFTKGHGTENDFVLVPDLDGALDLTASLAASLADRRAGIGGDGVIRVVPTDAAGEDEVRTQAGRARWFMDYRNADGSTAEMCGNGARVFAAYLRREGLETADEFAIATRSGTKTVRFEGDLIAVGLGPWRLLDPEKAAADGFDALVHLDDGDPYSALSLDLGNPHTVLALPEQVDLAAVDLARVPVVRPLPPRGTNVEVVRPVGPGHIAMRVHERGVGETRSCGTGACAAALATSFWSGEPVPTRDWTVDVPGGRLRVRGLPGHEVELAGPGGPSRRRPRSARRPRLSAAGPARAGPLAPVAYHRVGPYRAQMGTFRRTQAITLLAAGTLAVSVAAPATAQTPTSGPVGHHRDHHGSQLPKVPTMRGGGGAVSSVDRDASQIGIDVLRRGGNAADAAIATAAALGVTEPYSTGLGGGGFFVYYDAKRHRVTAVDGRETAPSTFTPDVFTNPDGSAMDFRTVVSSGLSIGTPGTPATWDLVTKRFGTRSLSRLLAPAQRLARQGFVVDQTFHDQTAQNAARFAMFPETADLFLPGGDAPAVGTTFRNPDLARTYGTHPPHRGWTSSTPGAWPTPSPTRRRTRRRRPAST